LTIRKYAVHVNFKEFEFKYVEDAISYLEMVEEPESDDESEEDEDRPLPDELFNECIVRYVFEDHLHLY
jgi:hypothetical protein